MALVALVAAGCAGDEVGYSPAPATSTTAQPDTRDGPGDGPRGNTDTTRTPRGLEAPFNFSEEEYACINDRAAPSLPAPLGTLWDLGELTETQLVAVAAVIDDCATDKAAASWANEYFDGLAEELNTPIDDAARSCLAVSLQGRLGQAVTAFFSSPDLSNDPLLDVIDPCLSDEQIGGFVAHELREAGATDTQAACVADILGPAFSLADVVGISVGDPLSPELSELALRAEQECT